ncbi:MAG TPA: UDP-3-O-(3-hydroxymyristoyl)glucosamine N-acyltransferase [Chlamydiales bacterium]|nr:UDP-3-O-(3-hydroxymyristoyl)glucosamine N-acyltransferase [Chlamydiales bacterium]
MITLAELAEAVAAQLIGDPNEVISGVNTLDEATQKDASFLANPRYAHLMKQSAAGVICVETGTQLSEGKNYLVSCDPSLTFQKIAQLLLPIGQSGFRGIHPTAIIHASVQIGNEVSIGPYAVIDRDSIIGHGTVIGPHVSIGFEVHIGNECYLHPGSIIRERCKLGNRVIVQPGAIIGSCGFGFVADAKGRYQKLEQIGIVILEDDVEIGANTTIDRSRFKATIIRRGSKIDNLCQIAHNVEIGEDNVIAAQTGIAGSSKTGKHVMLGGQVGVVGHVELADEVMVASRGGISKSLKKGKYRGSPAIPIQEYHRQEVYIRKLEEYFERLKDLEKKIAIRPLS